MSVPRTAIVMPGVGSYVPGALRRLQDRPAVRDTLDEVDDAVGDRATLPPSRLLVDPNAPDAHELMDRHELALHLAIYAGALAAFRLLEGDFGIRPDVLLGHSLGEMAALAAAGVFTAGDGARLYLARSAACTLYTTDPGGLLTLRLAPGHTLELLGSAQLPGLDLACDNSAKHTVVSGPDESLATFAALAKRRAVASKPLTVRTLFHNRLRESAATEWRRLGTDVEFRAPRYPVLSPLLGRDYADERELRDGVVGQLRHPVRYRNAVTTLRERGIEVFVETGARDVLGAFARAADPRVRTAVPVAAGADVVGVADTLRTCGLLPLDPAALAAPSGVPAG
ncbi:ACP S-malonyltransferase [Embleya hyalina]|uniref:[acyl-carrier-protein] S-malonyltransferase n=1 Tax=Embleya hyalina TaxID=516124 RepID=A0A401YJJ4_9ACTN|nr:acyltransferase domain-containing protein [Embleya hyalina]GCD94761.1 acyltransferase [Embleya hyalina]